MTGLRIDVADLLTHPGSRRAIELEVVLPGLAGTSARVDGPVRLDLVLERIPDGIVARGAAAGRWTAQCSEGLEALEQPFELAVDELFEGEPVEGETYPIEGREIDLDQLVRDTVVLELPLAPVCGAGHPEVSLHSAGSSGDDGDPRWAALSALEFPEAVDPQPVEKE